jgi:hypothetical protein
MDPPHENSLGVPFRIGDRRGKSVHLASSEHITALDQALRDHWHKVAGFLAEGHCPGCGGRFERLEQWAHCDACHVCWQLGRDHDSGNQTISWMHGCLHGRSADLARFFRFDDVKKLLGEHGSPWPGAAYMLSDSVKDLSDRESG